MTYIHIHLEQELNSKWFTVNEIALPSTEDNKSILFKNNITLNRELPKNASEEVWRSKNEKFLDIYRNPFKKKIYGCLTIAELKIMATVAMLKEKSIKHKNIQNLLKLFPDTEKNNYRIIYFYYNQELLI